MSLQQTNPRAPRQQQQKLVCPGEEMYLVGFKTPPALPRQEVRLPAHTHGVPRRVPNINKNDY